MELDQRHPVPGRADQAPRRARSGTGPLRRLDILCSGTSATSRTRSRGRPEPPRRCHHPVARPCCTSGSAGSIDSAFYTGREDSSTTWSTAYRDAVAAFYDAGCRYLQFDDTAWAYLCSDVEREQGPRARHRHRRHRRALRGLLNRALEGKPDDMVVTTHVCRGNFRSTWISSGGYEPVAEQLLGVVNYDGYFLEYDTERAGGFEPLRFLPKGDKTVVLGLVTSKSGELENTRRHQAAHRRGDRVRAARAARAEPAMRLRLDRGGQRAHRGRAVGEAPRGRGRSRTTSGSRGCAPSHHGRAEFRRSRRIRTIAPSIRLNSRDRLISAQHQEPFPRFPRSRPHTAGVPWVWKVSIVFMPHAWPFLRSSWLHSMTGWSGSSSSRAPALANSMRLPPGSQT